MKQTRRPFASLQQSGTALTFALGYALVASSPVSAQSVQDFQLPTPTPTPTGPAVQGPIDDSGIIPRAPRAVNTPTPSPAPSPTPRATPTSTERPISTATQGPVVQQRPSPRVTAAPTPLPSAIEPLDSATGSAPVAAESDAGSPSPLPLPTVAVSPNSVPDAVETPPDEGGWPWPWLLLAVVAAVGLGWLLRRRKGPGAPPPVIERPVVDDTSQRRAELPPTGKPLAIKAEAVKLSRSMMNATLHYRLTLTNRTSSVLTNVTIGGDMIGARNGTPIDQQVADSDADLCERHAIGRISPGQTLDFTGTLQLPLSDIRPILRGTTPLFVPLMRWRVQSGTIDPVVRTFVIGMRPDEVGGKLQPFRLDEQPQTYARISQRALD